MKKLLLFTICSCVFLLASAQQEAFITNVLKETATGNRLEAYAHELLDKIGPRLVGTPQVKQANDWLVRSYASFGVAAKNEQYGTWRGWQRGITHVDLLSPRVRTLEATQLAWSPATNGTVSGSTIILPTGIAASAAFAKWLSNVRNKFVLVAANPLTGIPKATWDEFGIPGDYERLKSLEKLSADNVLARNKRLGGAAMYEKMENAGALGFLTLYWSQGYGVNKIFSAQATKVPVIDLSLEDYGLLYRLTQSGSKPVIAVNAVSKTLGTVPVYNTIATIPGAAKANEFVILSAHLDSWDGASGATDNGTGTIIMLEAMRLLKKFYPHPKRTIIAGHWNSEEQGLNGSRAFVEDHPEIVKNIQAVFNQDNGTGRVVNISGQELQDAESYITRWLQAVPDSIRKEIKTVFPGTAGRGGSDYASFLAASAPAFSLTSNSWNYFTYTWHTNRDTYDKIVFDEVKRNVILVAILAYMASEDEQATPHAFIEAAKGDTAAVSVPRKANRTGIN